MSPVETTELAVKASQRPAGKVAGGRICQRAQPIQIGAKGDGEEMQGVAGGAVVEDVVDPGTEDAVLVVEEAEVEMLDLISWHATIVQCVAIWPVTIPPLVARP